jgi:hypothetical protein
LTSSPRTRPIRRKPRQEISIPGNDAIELTAPVRPIARPRRRRWRWARRLGATILLLLLLPVPVILLYRVLPPPVFFVLI